MNIDRNPYRDVIGLRVASRDQMTFPRQALPKSKSFEVCDEAQARKQALSVGARLFRATWGQNLGPKVEIRRLFGP